MADSLIRLHRDTVSIFNRVKDGLYEDENWQMTVIHHVGMEIDQQQNIRATGIESADKCNLIIPAEAPDKEYIEATEYERLPEDERAEYWTLKEDDFFVKGDLSNIDTSQPDLFQKISKEYGENRVFRITTIGDLTGKCLPKWKVGGR